MIRAPSEMRCSPIPAVPFPQKSWPKTNGIENVTTQAGSSTEGKKRYSQNNEDGFDQDFDETGPLLQHSGLVSNFDKLHTMWQVLSGMCQLLTDFLPNSRRLPVGAMEIAIPSACRPFTRNMGDGGSMEMR